MSIIPSVSKVKAQIQKVSSEAKLCRAQLKLIRDAKAAKLSLQVGSSDEEAIEARITVLVEQGKLLRRQLNLSEAYAEECRQALSAAGKTCAEGAEGDPAADLVAKARAAVEPGESPREISGVAT